MEKLLLIVEAFLDGKHIAHQRVEEGCVSFELPFDGSKYACHISQEDEDVLHVEIHWLAHIEPKQLEEAQLVLERISWIEGERNQTFVNRALGTVVVRKSLMLASDNLPTGAVGGLLATVLDPFNYGIRAVRRVVEDRLLEDEAVAEYIQVHYHRISGSVWEFAQRYFDSGTSN